MLVLAILVSNPDIYDLSIFGAVVQVTSAGIFITGAITMAVTILALLLLRTGIRRGRARRKQLKELEASDASAASASTTPAETPTTTETSSTRVTDKPTNAKPPRRSRASIWRGKSSTTAAERQAMLDEADALTREMSKKSFLEIFQPGLKHLREERDRQKMPVVRRHTAERSNGYRSDAGKATIAVYTISARVQDPEANDTGPA